MPSTTFMRHAFNRLAHSAPASISSLHSIPSETHSIGERLIDSILDAKLRRVGSPPQDFLELSGHSPKTVLKALDTKAEQLRLQAAGHPNPTPNTPFAIRAQSVKTFLRQKFTGGIRLTSSLQTQKIGSGRHADVYKVSLPSGGNPYVLKVFNVDTMSTLEPEKEIANGLFFTGRQTRDVSKLYAGSLRHGWTLTEYIAPNSTLATRTGLTMQEQGVHLSDSHPANFINGIRVDHGGNLRRLAGSPKPTSGNMEKP